MSTSPKHIVAFPYQAWGHARPLINLAARLVKLRDINVTLLSTDLFYDRAVAELARSFVPGEEEFAKRIRVVSLSATHVMAINGVDDSFKALWLSIAAGEAVTCSKTGTQFAALPPPQAVIIDHALDSSSLSNLSVLFGSSVGSSTYSLFYVFGPESLGGRGDINTIILAEVERTGRPYNEVAEEVAFATKGEVVKVPALPPMYDYEYHPQDFPFPKELATLLFPHVYKTLDICDGVLLMTPEPYEPDAVAAVRKWYAETGRSAYVCGPLLPPKSATAKAKEQQQSKEATEISAFLDTTLKTSGKKSLLYISFGSIFWPIKSPETIWAFLDVVMERNIPFIMSHASPLATVPDEVKEKVKAYGKGIMSPWSPQQTILEHPATGWYVAHGGHNGVTESICAGVPFILWPFGGDQPMNAVHISEQLKIGYELIEVRTGDKGRHTIYRTGRTPVGTIEAIKAEARDVLAKAYGPDGAEKRQRLVALQHAITHEWEEGGAALRDMKTFLDSV
ncbi:UDP-Glycosyltransferase/glycogen phosphorylase [Trametes versicolor FP-101664 SS1]|uniref:UDP-Glycosyltransferase/glycogen phosphorylase n=1 Tax=Trametes versicolor (strain FP-101664) TaxID=717944 RepID=UPI0004623EDC|nr:UDP-Glycosyltransferase/glycogen phosphorylase [Trametes versicolor FP-101664 SS1]EIW63123.1 UDP-Glycosyltransferase/glycogen phosphorylase [Trametes versicolor FP-101664 SS1]